MTLPFRRAGARALTAALLVLSVVVPTASARAAAPDSTRQRAAQRWVHLSLSGGLGGMTAPAAPRRQYQPGTQAALAAHVRLLPRTQWLTSVAYQDLQGKNDLERRGDADSLTLQLRAYGNGSQFLFLSGLEARVRGPLLVRALAGTSHHRAGDVLDLGYVDPLQPTPSLFPAVPDRTGWGAAWGFGASYEFQPSARDHFVIETEFVTARSKADDLLRFVGVRFGYRIF